jgi:hypothetical protein
MTNLNDSCEDRIRDLKLEQAKGNRMMIFTSFALIALVIIGSGVMMLYQAPINYNIGYDNGNSDGNDEGYTEGYENGTNDATDELTADWTSLSIIVSENFEIIIENDTEGIYNDTTFDLRRLDFSGIFWNLELINDLYAYIEANNDSSVDLTNATDIEEKLNYTSMEAGTFDITFAQAFSMLQYIENTESIIGNEYLIQEYNKAFMFTIDLFLYANDTFFDADAEEFETMLGDQSEFTIIEETTGTFILGGLVFDLTAMEELAMIRTMDNLLEINSISLNVGEGTYIVNGLFNSIEFEMVSFSFVGG